MNGVELAREDSHPRAREALADAFFWDASDLCSPFGDETGQEVLEAFRDFRVEEPRGNPLALLGELLARWEVADEAWDAVDPDEVQAIGAADELGLLLRDEAVIALAFAQIVVEGRGGRWSRSLGRACRRSSTAGATTPACAPSASRECGQCWCSAGTE